VARIRGASFETVRRGYDPEQVRGFLGWVADHVEGLEAELLELRAKLQRAGPPDPYEAVSGRLAEMIRAFDRELEEQRGAAREERERILEEARAEAERVRNEARGELEAARAEAARLEEGSRAAAQRRLAALEARRAELRREIEFLRRRLAAALRDLDLSTAEADRVVRVDGPAAEEAPAEEGDAERPGVPPGP
jgi:DivIVA domain-containing protein